MSPRVKNRLILAAILAPFVLFFVVGRFVIDPWELPRENQGQLIIPHLDLASLQAKDADDTPFDRDDTQGQWTLMYIAGDDCPKACKNALYYQMRQVRRALGEDVDRVRRVIVQTAPPSPAFQAFLKQKVAGMVPVQAALPQVREALEPVYAPQESEPRGDIFLVSPDGQIFMRYPSHEDMDATLEEAENIRVDLKRTLKGSLIG